MQYAIQATRHINAPEGKRRYQLPTFYLDADVQGITNADQAVMIARQIIELGVDQRDSVSRVSVSISAFPI